MTKKDKQKALKLLKEKDDKKNDMTYEEIAYKTGYEKRQIVRLSQKIKKEDIDSILTHGLKNKPSNNSASRQEIEYIEKYKKQYPVISITQFHDYYIEDIIKSGKNNDDIKKYGLKERSISFFKKLFKDKGWKSPIKHKKFKNDTNPHSLRDPMPRRGMLIMTDGTPHDWFQDGRKFTLHLVIDDATGEILAGWFEKNETQHGYCMVFVIMFEKYGLPEAIYGDRTSILWDSKEENKTQLARMLEELGIELIYANSAEAKGKIEKMNNTLQNRLVNDIKRFNIQDYDQLNTWFNDFYIGYINSKFSYEPSENESSFVPLGENNLKDIMCLKYKRKILNGNMISYKNSYYIPLKDDEEDFVFYKGTTVEVWEDVFDNTIRIHKGNKTYKTRKINGHRIDPEKRKQKIIQDQKQLEQLFRERDERTKHK